jgi:hypothetical protein
MAAAAKPPQAIAARLSRYSQVQLATTWFLDREEQFYGKTPPTELQDVADARVQIPGVSRSVVRRFRPIAWRVGRGHRPKSPKT